MPWKILGTKTTPLYRRLWKKKLATLFAYIIRFSRCVCVFVRDCDVIRNSFSLSLSLCRKLIFEKKEENERNQKVMEEEGTVQVNGKARGGLQPD